MHHSEHSRFSRPTGLTILFTLWICLLLSSEDCAAKHTCACISVYSPFSIRHSRLRFNIPSQPHTTYSIQTVYTTLAHSKNVRTHARTQPHTASFTLTSTNDPCWYVQFPIRMPKRKTMRFFGFIRVICSASVVMANIYIIYSTHSRSRTQPSRSLNVYFDPIAARHFRISSDVSHNVHATKWTRSPGDALCVHGFLFHREQSGGDVTFRFSKTKILTESHRISPNKLRDNEFVIKWYKRFSHIQRTA